MPDRPVRDPLTVGEAFDVMLDSSDSVRRSADFLETLVSKLVKVVKSLYRVGIPIIAALGLVSVALIFQIELRDDKIARMENTQIELKMQLKDTKDAANEAKNAAAKAQLAAESADASLKAAIANSQQAGQQTNEAIDKIDRIYNAFCVQRGQC